MLRKLINTTWAGQLHILGKSVFSEHTSKLHTSIAICAKRNPFLGKLEESFNQSSRSEEKSKKQGIKNYLKKHQRYADYNYQEWRFPKSNRAIDISCTRDIIQPYEDDNSGSKSSLSVRKKLSDLRHDILHNRIVKKRVDNFHRKRFPAEAQDIYIKAHNLLNTPNWTIVNQEDTEERLQNLVTEHAYTDMVKGLDSKTVIWKWNESLEPPRVVRIRASPMITNNNYYGQVTVRFHSKQTLAIYDRFGRLMYGSPDEARNVLEFVVFERHISHPYGCWRIHGKISSDSYQKEPMRKTVAFMKQKPQRIESLEWHEQEEKENHYKWYPERYHYIAKKEALKYIRRDSKYWGKRRKKRIYTHHKAPVVRLRGPVARLVRRKRNIVREMREHGKLPYPPRDQDS
uniref:39S ribosomal protein L45, mitochondrial-like n=1 Tax=Ciona intestinalis TaxID=7719 RepID=UPI000180B11A|nr:39S ribosomal protein L45, mitochondrial-like [Ciona intestinalis]|eukprot:XP_002125945.1 39S ribosomal protein L45, mitochondrial-like [Ciona intestinalis]